jgi:hypothetical protein
MAEALDEFGKVDIRDSLPPTTILDYRCKGVGVWRAGTECDLC